MVFRKKKHQLFTISASKLIRVLRKIGLNTAARATLIILALTIIYHILIITQIIPYEAVWGGRLETAEQMIQFETISISLNLIFVFIIVLKANYLNLKFPKLLNNLLLYLMSGIFALNTVGNIFSENLTEAIIFTPLTLVLSVLCLRIAIE